jgi:DNA-binding CsgD family transcriptional regulator
MMSLANTVGFAVFSNDVAYLGSVFLSMFMFFTIVRLCGFEIKKVHVITCVSLGAIMFAVIASSPMLPLYYKSVDIEMIDGAAKLVKEYGVLHPVYMVYLLGYFAAMLVTIVHSVKKKKIGKPKLAGFIAAIVCGNLVIWLFEKMVRWEYEFLSVTYIISEFLLLIVYWMLQDYVYINDIPKPVTHEEKVSVIFMDSRERAEKIKQIIAGLPEEATLTARQIDILEGILAGKSRKEMAADLHLSENTVKMHTTSLFKILKVTSREEIFARIKA